MLVGIQRLSSVIDVYQRNFKCHRILIAFIKILMTLRFTYVILSCRSNMLLLEGLSFSFISVYIHVF